MKGYPSDHEMHEFGKRLDRHYAIMQSILARLTALEGARTMRSGDTIFHRPSGEHWLVAAVSPKRDEVVCCGWPETIAKAADCEVVRHCTDAEHQEMLAEVIRSCPDQIRGSWARAALEGSAR